MAGFVYPEAVVPPGSPDWFAGIILQAVREAETTAE